MLGPELQEGAAEAYARGASLAQYEGIEMGVDEVTNILFSSGTTGEPKAIPWAQTEPLRCALDAFAHMDVRHRGRCSALNLW